MVLELFLDYTCLFDKRKMQITRGCLRISWRLWKASFIFITMGEKNEKKKRVARIYKNGQNVLMLKDYVYLFGTSTDLKLSSYQRAEQHLKLK